MVERSTALHSRWDKVKESLSEDSNIRCSKIEACGNIRYWYSFREISDNQLFICNTLLIFKLKFLRFCLLPAVIINQKWAGS